MKKSFFIFWIFLLTIGSVKSQIVVKLTLPDNCNKNVTSIENIDMNGAIELKIFPNPTQGVFEVYLKSESFINQAEIKLLDLKGKVIYKESFYCSTKNFVKKFNLTGLPSGIYILSFTNSELEYSTKLIVK